MGTEIRNLIRSSDNIEVAIGVDRNKVKADFLCVESIKKVDAKKVDVVVDFSLPELFSEALEWAVKNKKAFVSGTTGLSKKQKQEIQKASKAIPVLWSANMSLGINLICEILKNFSAAKDFDFQIVEAHHNKKKDAPSGTAVLLQDHLEAAIDRKVPTALSLRGGGIFGIHEVWAMGQEEVIKIEHNALNRSVFARGAISVASWISGQKPGLYQVADVLKSKK
jgi:4-hydroxy-tetrahydrodipicolinate reductase